MNRRELLKQLALLTGGAMSYPAIAAVLDDAQTKVSTRDYELQTFSVGQNELVIRLAELIIPATDTPGAEAAGVNRFIDHMLANWSTEKDRHLFLDGLEQVQALCKEQYGHNFIDLRKPDQLEILRVLEQENKRISDINGASGEKGFFTLLKTYTVIGYYTSEIGCIEELKLNLVPGYYDGCLPYAEIGRAWSVLNLL